MKNLIVNNFWIKIVSLLLAVITWFYVNVELNKERRLSASFYESSYMRHISPSTVPAVDKQDKKMNKGYIVESR
ncbi:MAG: hypothetical protein ABIG92_07550 [Candidatus Omnitrophota bacterium]